MSIRIRRANLQSDRLALIDLFRRHLALSSDARRFDWLYCNGPQGAARAWLAVDAAEDAIIGGAAAFPRKVYFQGRETTAMVLGDFCIDEEYRSLGPSLQLQRACLGAVAEGPFEFFYDFPSTSMMAIYNRLGIPQTDQFVRWAKPLRAERKLESLVHSKTLARGLGVVANTALAWRGWKGSASGCTFELHTGPCQEEFSILDAELRLQPGIRAVRTAEFVNWRYLENPTARHEILAARKRRKLAGYVVFTADVEAPWIVDLCCVQEPALIAGLLAAAVDRLRRLGAETVNLNAGESHPWRGIFKRAGFRARESSPVVARARDTASISEVEFRTNWPIMRGDRES